MKHSLNDSLILASVKGDIVKIKSLLKEGADINAKDENGNTGLIFASRYSNRADSVRLLLDKGADVNAKNNKGSSSLMVASGNSNSTSSDDIIRLLLDNGADPFTKSNEGKYPLYWCETISCKKIISNAMWKIMNNTIKKSAKWFSDQPETPISKNVWKLILLRNKQRQLCKDLSKEENKYVLQGFAGMLNIPITEKMTKSQLCNLVSNQLSQGEKYTANKENIPDIIKLAKNLGINTDQSIDKILDDISSIV